MIEKKQFYADIFEPETDYIKCLNVEEIDACVLRAMTQDSEMVFPDGENTAEFMVDLDTNEEI